MYSLVMLAAMTSAPDSPEFFGLMRRGNCCGCSGFSSCYGCYGGCYGGSSCYGSYYSCHGCGGGCYGSYYAGCGGCYGSTAFYSSCLGCTGGCYGGPMYGIGGYGFGCTGGSVLPGGGCYGGAVIPGTVAPAGGVGLGGGMGGGDVGPGGAGGGLPKGDDPDALDKLDMGGVSTGVPASRAEVVVNVPAGAKLYANGASTKLTGTRREFTTPTLRRGRSFVYDFRAEYTRGGRPVTERKSVTVRAGRRSVVSFGPAAAPGRVESELAVNLPEGAKLYVDGVLRTAEAGTKKYRTPKLPAGRRFTYTLRAELNRGGRVASQTKRVEFTAGETVNVNFDKLAGEYVSK